MRDSRHSLPVPDKDGKRLFAVGQKKRIELLRYDIKAGQFVPFLSGISGAQVDVSRDGQWVAYISYPDNMLWRSKLNGSERLQLTYPPMAAALPRWSPDGKRIAFRTLIPGKSSKIFIVPANGGTSEEVVSEDRGEVDPAWSPDGNSLIFGRLRTLEPGIPASSRAIYMVNLITHQISTLPGSEGLFSPKWAPDGRYLAAMPEGSSKLILFDFKKQAWSLLDTEHCPCAFPSWSHDGTYLYFLGFPGDDQAIYRLKISDRTVQRLASMKDLRMPDDRYWGIWIGLAQDDTPLTLRDTSVREIYALDWELP